VTGGGGSKLVKNSMTYFMDGPQTRRRTGYVTTSSSSLCLMRIVVIFTHCIQLDSMVSGVQLQEALFQIV